MNLSLAVSLCSSRSRRSVANLLVALTLVFGLDVVAVFAAAGDLDLSFDGDGIRILSRSGNERGQAVAIQQDDSKIVVAGYSNVFGSNDVLVTRLNENGSVDATFNGGQPQVVSRTGDDRGQAVALQSDGKIVVAGYTNVFGTTDILVMRFNPTGSLDPTFSNGGVFVLRRTGAEFGQAVAIQSKGQPGEKIVVVGDTDNFGTKDAFVLRLNLDGRVDNTFANSGTQTVVRRTGNEQPQAVAVRGDDRLVVAGTTDGLGTNDVFVLQLNANGTLDGTFSAGGVSIVDRASDDRGNGVALRPDGRIVVAGSTDVFGTTDFFVVQLNARGGLDQSFSPTRARRGVRGGVRTIEQTGEDRAQAVIIQPDGKIVLAGVSTLFGLNDFMLVRLNSNGSLDTTFDRDGRQLAGPFGENRAQALASQVDQKIVVVGHTDTFDVSDLEVMRFLGQ